MKLNPLPKPDPCARETRSYDDHARNLHQRATDAYPAWLASLSPEERRLAESLDLTTPPDDDPEVGGHSPYSISDIADTPLARTDTDYAAAIDLPHEILADQFGITAPQAQAILAWHNREVHSAVEKEKANFLQLIVGGLLSSKNPKLNAAGLAFANNLAALNGLPCQREFARQNHVSPSAVSKIVKAWQVTLGLRPSTHQKSEKACQTYSQVGKARHWRSVTVTAGLASSLLSRLRPANPPADPTLN